MKCYSQILTAFLLMGCILPISCKKGVSEDEKIPGATIPGAVRPQNRLVPLNMGSGNSKMIFNYTPDYSLSKIEYGDGTGTVLELTAAGYPVMLYHYDGVKEVAFTQYKVDDKGRIIRGIKYKLIAGNNQVMGRFEISYETSSRVSTISYYDNVGENEIFIGTEKRFYADNGNLIKEQREGSIGRVNYSYDDKNGLFKNVKNSWIFAIEEENNLFHSVENNISAGTYPLAPSTNQSFAYTYNADQYPETITSQISGKKLTYKVSYKNLK